MATLKSSYVVRKIGEDYFAVCVTSTASAQQMIKLNETGAFLFEKCKEGINEEALVTALLDEYDVSRELAAADVARFIDNLRANGLIDE